MSKARQVGKPVGDPNQDPALKVNRIPIAAKTARAQSVNDSFTPPCDSDLFSI
jgi:hypothetical protein